MCPRERKREREQEKPAASEDQLPRYITEGCKEAKQPQNLRETSRGSTRIIRATAAETKAKLNLTSHLAMRYLGSSPRSGFRDSSAKKCLTTTNGVFWYKSRGMLGASCRDSSGLDL